jgi:hypothetical protein
MIFSNTNQAKKVFADGNTVKKAFHNDKVVFNSSVRTKIFTITMPKQSHMFEKSSPYIKYKEYTYEIELLNCGFISESDSNSIFLMFGFIDNLQWQYRKVLEAEIKGSFPAKQLVSINNLVVKCHYAYEGSFTYFSPSPKTDMTVGSTFNIYSITK